MRDIEHRTLTRELRVKSKKEGSDNIGTVEGYAALFDTRSELIAGSFFEVIQPGAFDEVMDDDVRALYNHRDEDLLGRTASGTLRIELDDRGLQYSVDLPDTSDGRDVRTLIDRGDLRESSFGFSIAPGGEDWAVDDEGRTIRTISKIQKLWDVSPVAFPAYADTEVALRSLTAFQRSLEETEDEDEGGESPASDDADSDGEEERQVQQQQPDTSDSEENDSEGAESDDADENTDDEARKLVAAIADIEARLGHMRKRMNALERIVRTRA